MDFFLFFVFILGLIIGSFLNVVILRYNTSESIGGRSRCFTCSKQLGWHELVPVFSFVFQGGKCRGCKSAISWQYPLVEILTGAVFVLVALKSSLSSLFSFYLVAFSVLIAISVYDLRHKIIPDGLVYALIVVSFFRVAWFGWNEPSVVEFFSGVALYLFFAALWLVSKGTWMGYGDAKLALAIGWLLPYPYNIFGVMAGFWIGAVYGVSALIFQHFTRRWRSGGLSMKSEVPFAPFLALGALVSFMSIPFF